VPGRRELQKIILTLVDELPAVHVQNRLMSCTDRDIALALSGLTDDEIDRVLHHVSQSKARRVVEEIRLKHHRHLDRKNLDLITLRIVHSLRSERSVTGDRGFLRPRRPNQRGSIDRG
jgi:hypothetical protein